MSSNSVKTDWILGINVAGHGASICLLHRGTICFFLKDCLLQKWIKDLLMILN